MNPSDSYGKATESPFPLMQLGCWYWDNTLFYTCGLRRKSRHKRQAMTGGLRKLHNKVEEVNSSPKKIGIINQNEIGRAHGTHGRKCLKKFARKPRRKATT
jgi:hypothetical protein